MENTPKTNPAVAGGGGEANAPGAGAVLASHSITKGARLSRPPNPLAVWHLARFLAGASDADVDVILSAFPGCPADGPNSREAVKTWLKERPDVAEAVARVDPEGPPPGRPPLKLLSADEILDTDWPELVWVAPELLPSGLTILAGRPKVGKSWLALQIALAVASGGMVFGQRVESGPVLYLALEDPPRRLHDRMMAQGWTRGLPAEFMPIGEFTTQIGDLRDGGGERLAQQIEAREYRLTVIDTLSRSVYGDQSDVEDMTAALTPLQEMAHTYNTAVLMVDHHRKGFGTNPDAVGDILGSTAKGALADCVWGLYKERGKAEAKLQITGRDVLERTLALMWDPSLSSWHCEGDAYALEMTERRQEILDALKELGRASVKDIAEVVGQPKSNTHTRLQDLVSSGLVRRIKKRRSVWYEPA